MAIIKSGVTTDELTVDPTSKAARVTLYDTAGAVVTDPVPLVLSVNPVTVVNNDLVASFDASEYSYISLQLSGTWVGAVRFQGSNDNGTFQDVVAQNAGDLVDPYDVEITTNSLIKIPIIAKYIRVRVTTYTSGTVEGSARAYQHDIHTGQISSTGEVTIAASQTVGLDTGANTIGAVGLNAGTAVIGDINNLAEIGGVAVSMGAGTVDAGTQRVVLPDAAAVSTDFYVTGVGAVDVNSRMIRTGACQLISAVMTSYAATPRHIKLYDTATAPVAGVGTPVLVLTRAAVGNNSYPLPEGGFPFVNGIGMTFVQGAANNNTVGTATVDASLTSIFT